MRLPSFLLALLAGACTGQSSIPAPGGNGASIKPTPPVIELRKDLQAAPAPYKSRAGVPPVLIMPNGQNEVRRAHPPRVLVVPPPGSSKPQVPARPMLRHPLYTPEDRERFKVMHPFLTPEIMARVKVMPIRKPAKPAKRKTR
jgi:hypothetical protein